MYGQGIYQVCPFALRASEQSAAPRKSYYRRRKVPKAPYIFFAFAKNLRYVGRAEPDEGIHTLVRLVFHLDHRIHYLKISSHWLPTSVFAFGPEQLHAKR